jgi:hypothetical protein
VPATGRLSNRPGPRLDNVPGDYTCRVCGGTGKSPVPFDATVGFLGSGISDLPPCAMCAGTGRVEKLARRDRDLFDLIPWAIRRLMFHRF